MKRGNNKEDSHNPFEKMWLASFKYPSLSKDGVKRPDDVFYPGALTERYCPTQQFYQARTIKIHVLGAKVSPGLVLDNAVWNSHLPAEGWQEHHQLRKDQMLSNFPTTNDINKDFSVFFRRQSSSFNSVEEVTVYIMRKYLTISGSIPQWGQHRWR